MKFKDKLEAKMRKLAEDHKAAMDQLAEELRGLE